MFVRVGDGLTATYVGSKLTNEKRCVMVGDPRKSDFQPSHFSTVSTITQR